MSSLAQFNPLRQRRVGTPAHGNGHAPLGGRLKRVCDIAFAGAALLASAIVFAVVAALLAIFSPGPIFFRHERIGFGGKRFDCLKFRTMVLDADARLEAHLASNPTARAEFATMRKLRDDPRIVPGIGAFLRKTSLDELPQLVNVLRGEMSLVGPRPVTEAEIEDYGMHRKDYLKVRPGITGLWQVSGRNELSFARRVAIDRVYVRNWSLRSDAAILVRTVKILVTRRGAF